MLLNPPIQRAQSWHGELHFLTQNGRERTVPFASWRLVGKSYNPWLSQPAKTERERMYLDAVSKIYEGYDNTSGDERWHRYMAAMQQLRSKYPRDQEASLFYAVALTWTVAAGKAGMDQRREALDILLPIFEQNPK